MKRNDGILIAVILGIAMLSYFGYRLIFHAEGQRVTVTVGKTLYKELPLDSDTILEIEGVRGNNVLRITDRQVQVIDADCSDHICVKHKPISKNGESIICLPNQVVIAIEGGDLPEIDAIVQ